MQGFAVAEYARGTLGSQAGNTNSCNMRADRLHPLMQASTTAAAPALPMPRAARALWPPAPLPTPTATATPALGTASATVMVAAASATQVRAVAAGLGARAEGVLPPCALLHVEQHRHRWCEIATYLPCSKVHCQSYSQSLLHSPLPRLCQLRQRQPRLRDAAWHQQQLR